MAGRCPINNQYCTASACALWNYEAETCGLICPLVPDYGADLRKLIKVLETMTDEIKSAVKGEY